MGDTRTFVVHLTVPEGFDVEQNELEEALAAAAAEINGDELSRNYAWDDYDATVIREL